MSVFPFPQSVPFQSSLRLVSNTAVYGSEITGAFKTTDRSGERWQLTMSFRNLNDQEKSTLTGWLARINGMEHRFTVYDHAQPVLGNLSVTEMLDVTFNATNWESLDSQPDRGSLSDITGGVRFVGGTDFNVVPIVPTANSDGIATPTVGVTYAATIFGRDPRPSPSSAGTSDFELRFLDANWGSAVARSASITEGQRVVVAATCHDATEFYVRPMMKPSADTDTQGYTQDLLQLSVGRCLLVDNGFNALTYSEQLDHADWTKTRATISANAVAGPDGNTTADELIEDATASNTHIVRQSYTRAAAAEFWTASVRFKSNTSQRIQIWVDDGSANGGTAKFDATTGAIEAAATELNSGEYAFASIHDLGGGWYRARLTAKIPSTTEARVTVFLCDGATNVTSFNGDGSSGLYIAGIQLARGHQLGRYTKTEATETTGTDQTGSGAWFKGLDASVSQQLRDGVWFEVDGNLHKLTADLDGDASGCGYAEFKPRFNSAPADEAPVILLNPTGKFALASPSNGWDNSIGGFGNFVIEAIQDIA